MRAARDRLSRLRAADARADRPTASTAVDDLDPADNRRRGAYPRLQGEALDGEPRAGSGDLGLADEHAAPPSQIALAWLLRASSVGDPDSGRQATRSPRAERRRALGLALSAGRPRAPRRGRRDEPARRPGERLPRRAHNRGVADEPENPSGRRPATRRPWRRAPRRGRGALEPVRTSASETTSAYFMSMSARLCSCASANRSPTASRGTTTWKPCETASTAVARTQPEVAAPVTITRVAIGAGQIAGQASCRRTPTGRPW